MPVPPKSMNPVNGKACRGIGVSFSPEDIGWLNANYGEKTSITDKVRSAMYEAKCWRHHLAELDEKRVAATVAAVHSYEPYDAVPAADKVATERIAHDG